MNIKETSIADIIVYMIKNNADNVDIDFKIKGKKAGLKIEFVNKEEQNQWTNVKEKN